MKKTHFMGSLSWTTLSRSLTVLGGVVGGSLRARGGEEEEAAVDGDPGGEEREDLEVVELAGEVGLAAEGDDDEGQDHKEHRHRLHPRSERLHEHGDEYHAHLPVHDDCLPEIGAQLIPVVEKAVLRFHSFILQLQTHIT